MMHFMNYKLRCCLILLIAVSTLSTSIGCHRIPRNPVQESLLPPIPAEQRVPNEELKTVLPLYVIEPPDVLLIDAIKLIPKSPYRLELLDVVIIRVDGVYEDRPINRDYQIESDGRVNLGSDYGSIKLAGLTLEEAQEAVKQMLKADFVSPQVAVTLDSTAGAQQITGEHLVNQDGTVNLGTYGQVYVTGMTLHQAKLTIEDHLSAFLDDPQVAVDVFAYNSKVYYIITNGAGQGDQVIRLPIVGGETVLDAISELGGLSPNSTKSMWIARPAPDKVGRDVILPVDWDAIASDAAPATNYQVLPGDRIYIDGSKLVHADTFMGRVTAPFERTAGLITLGASTVRSLSIGFSSSPGNNNN